MEDVLLTETDQLFLHFQPDDEISEKKQTS